MSVRIFSMKVPAVGALIRRSLESFSFARKIVEDGEFGGSARRVNDRYLSNA